MSIPGYNEHASLLPVLPQSAGTIVGMRGGANGKQNDKQIEILGKTFKLEKPIKNTPITNVQNNIIREFGLDDLHPNEKYEILKAIYDNECNLDKPLIMISGCEPVRTIIETLGSHLLTRISKQPIRDSSTHIGGSKQKKIGKGTIKYNTRKKPKKYCIVNFE